MLTAAKPVVLATTRDSEDLGLAAGDSALTLEAETSRVSLTPPSENVVESHNYEIVHSSISTEIARPQSDHSDLYDSSIKDVRSEDEPRPQSPRSASGAEPSELMSITAPEGGQSKDGMPLPLNVKSIPRRPSTDSGLYNSRIQGPSSNGRPALDESEKTDVSTESESHGREGGLKSVASNLTLRTSKAVLENSLMLKHKEVAVSDEDKSTLPGSSPAPVATETSGNEAKSIINDLATSLEPGGKLSEESLVPRINLDLGPSPSHTENGSIGESRTSLERQIDDQLIELQNKAEERAAPATPTRLPPSILTPPLPVTQHPDPADPEPQQSVDDIASGLRISGVPPRSLHDHTSSLYSGVDSDISSTSHQDNQTLRSSPTTISSETMDAVTSTDLQGSLRGQAQTELRHLQLQLAEAKRRGDTHTAKASIQRSIELIQRTYLSGSAVGEHPTGTEIVNKLGFRRKSMLRLPSFSLLTNAKTSAIIEAANVGDLPRLRSLLEEKVNVNARSDNYRTPQMAAAIHGHLDCLKLLKNYAADEFATDGQGRTVMHVAVMANRLETVNWLLGAYPPSSPQIPKPWRLFRAAHAVKDMISHKILREVSDAEGSKPLHLATKLNLKGMVELLLAAGAETESKTNWGRTSLHEAVVSNHPGIAQILISSGAKTEAVDAESMSPLHLAAKLNHRESIDLLLANNANRYAYNGTGDLPIHVAARQGNISAIEALIVDRRDLSRTTKPGETLLHIACLTNGLTLADYLVQNALDMDMNPWARPQQTQLGLAGSVPPSSTETKKVNDLPQTPLHYSCTAGLYEMSALLIDHGAWVNATPDDGKTPLMMAVESENTNLVCLLLARGAKVNATMPGSCLTAMHISGRRGDLETTQVLFRGGANMLARTNDSRTPWEYSATKIKDPEKQKAINEYFGRINGVRIFNARKKGQPQAGTVGDQREWTLQGNTNPDTRIFAEYPPFQGSGPLQPGLVGPTPQVVYPQQYMDANNDSFPEAPPVYTPGPSAPRNLANRAPVHRPVSG